MIFEFVFFSILLVIPYICMAFRTSEYQYEWMDKSCVLALKGLAILTVLWAHTGAGLGIQHIQYISSIGVSLFLICSGYGMQMSYEQNRLTNYWRKRIIRVYVPFALVELIHLCVTRSISVENVRNVLVEFVRLTDYRWYIGYVFICYLLFWIIKRFVHPKYEMQMVWFCFFCWYLIDSMWFTISGMEFLRARQMLAFPLGVYLAKYKWNVKIEKTSNGKLMKWCVACLALSFITIVGMFYARMKGLPVVLTNGFSLLHSVPMAMIIILLAQTHRKLFQNRYLLFCGSISFEIYLCHIWEMQLLGVSTWISIALYVAVVYLTAWLMYKSEKSICKEHVKE